MSRIRTIKPEFWTNERVVECSTNARLLFIGLWNFCDDHGNHPASEKTCKANVFPCDDFTVRDIRRMLIELEAHGLIEFYVNENKRFFNVVGWHHQKIDRRQKPRYPTKFDECSTITHRGLDDHSLLYHRSQITDLDSGTTNLSGIIPNQDFQTERIVRKPKNPKLDNSPEFERFWQAYGHKLQRKAAEKAFAKAIKLASIETILAGVERYHQTRPEWQQIALAASWLNGERWNDQAQAQPNGHAKPNGRTQGRSNGTAEAVRWFLETEPEQPHEPDRETEDARRRKKSPELDV